MNSSPLKARKNLAKKEGYLTGKMKANKRSVAFHPKRKAEYTPVNSLINKR